MLSVHRLDWLLRPSAAVGEAQRLRPRLETRRAGRGLRLPLLVARLLILAKVLAHVVGILRVRVVLGLDVVDLVLERGRVQAEGSAVALAHVQRDVLRRKALLHGRLRSVHELRSQAHLAV